MVFRVLQEVCSNYEIDGLLLDFFRHLPTFKTTVLGGDATAAELELLTHLFRRIRRMADEVGAKRGRPILLAVRAPDSLGYAKALGLDLERWMQDDLIVETPLGSGAKYGTPPMRSFPANAVDTSGIADLVPAARVTRRIPHVKRPVEAQNGRMVNLG